MVNIKLSNNEIDKLPVQERIGTYYLLNRKNATNVITALSRGYNTASQIKREFNLYHTTVLVILKEFENRNIVEKVNKEMKKCWTFALTDFGIKLLQIIGEKPSINVSNNTIKVDEPQNKVEEKTTEIERVPELKNNVALYVNGKYRELIDILEKETPHNRYTIADIGFKLQLVKIAKMCDDNHKVNDWFEKYGSNFIEVI
jgi:DNA-binding HxlR family transcriptional regulator